MKLLKEDTDKKIYELNNGKKIVLLAQGDLTIKVGILGTSDQIGSFDFNFIDDDNGGIYKLTHMFLDEIDGYLGQGIGRQCLLFAKEHTGSGIFCGRDTGEEADDGSHLTGDGTGFAMKMLEEKILSGQI
ncbi:hypothetical protein [Vibrio ouci]|uniref:Uncharacterized protein n=1 Tax=Vibrio ouci TaxID=2499078 RepID=A0A4Y8WFQ6_9VIBR|nr:hypothetical protein [Vibrio ouci]TFH91148.1 hypothetical protein ELS82_13590 [Vibrio ouci]HAS6154360.1 hypothetical protein [Vibrio vulnificus]